MFSIHYDRVINNFILSSAVQFKNRKRDLIKQDEQRTSLTASCLEFKSSRKCEHLLYCVNIHSLHHIHIDDQS